MDSTTSYGFKIAILGATGAIAREIIRFLVMNDRCKQITVIVRRSLPEWETEPFLNTLNVIKCDDLGELDEYADDLADHDAYFSCLGCPSAKGKAMFKVVEVDYPNKFADIAIQNGVKMFYMISGEGINHKSWIWQLKYKGQVVEDMKEKGFDYLYVSKPGMLMNRDNDKRLIETIMKWVPFISKMKSIDVARAMVVDLLEKVGTIEEKLDPVILSNKQLLNVAKTGDDLQYYEIKQDN